jgi:hypothetical protein
MNPLLHVFGALDTPTAGDLSEIVAAADGMPVRRLQAARSTTPFPSSNDLEAGLVDLLASRGFMHHTRMRHPTTGVGFEYDFWRERDQVAMEVMGYRADDEVYKDILKFHVHDHTRVGVVWVPRWKWISGERTETNYSAAMKALAFADSHMQVDALVALAYDWSEVPDGGAWRLRFVAPGRSV